MFVHDIDPVWISLRGPGSFEPALSDVEDHRIASVMMDVQIYVGVVQEAYLLGHERVIPLLPPLLDPFHVAVAILIDLLDEIEMALVDL
jgi:hypothetical protein